MYVDLYLKIALYEDLVTDTFISLIELLITPRVPNTRLATAII